MRQKERQTHYDSTYRDSIASRGKMPSFEDLSQTTFGEYSFLPAAPRMEFSTYMAPKYYIAATVSMQAKDALLLCVNYGVTSLIMWKDRQTDTRPTLYTSAMDAASGTTGCLQIQQISRRYPGYIFLKFHMIFM